jgi:tetratricopeptide (TPR) repeat protein
MKLDTMKNILCSIAVCISLLPGSLLACINEFGTTRDGKKVAADTYTLSSLLDEQRMKESRAGYASWLKEMTPKVRQQPTYENIIDVTAVLIRNGHAEKSIPILLKLEAKFPKRYEVASNLGTAYELIGDNQQALQWIQEGIKRNPESHQGSEWLHVEILKAKLNQNFQSKPFQNGSLLSLKQGNQVMPAKPARLPINNKQQKVSLYQLAEALRYQLSERIYFVDAPDPVVAGLMFDLANLELAYGTMEEANILYDAAVKYGHSDSALIQKRQRVAKRILSDASRAATDYGNGECLICQP